MDSLTLLPKLPVINFENLKPGTSCWLSACNDVRHALEEYGCFLAVYERVSEELNKSVFHVLENLFDLPTETKLKNINPEKPYNGYVGPNPIIPLYESLGIKDATTIDGIQSFANLLWPSGNDHFCKIMHSYANLVSELEETVKKMVFESFGVEKYYASHSESVTYLLRVNKYSVPKMDETNLGVLPHTDKSFISILGKDQVNGLEVKTKAGEWVGVEYPPSSFMVMAGEAFTAWSNDRVHSPYHRVLMNGSKDRYSLGLFTFNKGITQIPEELVDDEHPQKFKSFDNLGLFEFHAKKGVQHQEDLLIKSFCGV